MSDSDDLEESDRDDDPDDLAAVVATVRERVDPGADERARLREVADRLTDRAERAATARCADADVIRVGSTARGTWTSGNRDIDIFARFPPNLDRDTLEEYGLAVGHDTLPEGHEEYAEHPYVKGTVEGFDIDVVPCFRLESATEIRSAVDRTPFHNEYLRKRLDDDLAADVRLTKQFLRGIGSYGSDLRTRGFSGFLTELLVCEYGGFQALLEAVRDWHPQVELDPEDHGQETFGDPLVVVDPTDPERNVAAVCSGENVARLQHYAREFLATPSVEYFEPLDPEPLTETELREHLEHRGTTPIAVRFDAPDLVDDQLYPQLEKSIEGITSGLDDRGFEVFRGTTLADDTAAIFVELAVSELPIVERHEGPPVHVPGHAEGFYDAYTADPDAYGPFIEGGRYVTERDRQFTAAREFLESDRLFDVGLGAHVETALESEYQVLVNEEVTVLLEEFGRELRQYFEPSPRRYSNG
ncbi:CCA tRNA nucleotidyltransferase [Natronobacterium gregoryi]|uniref:CCA-adding enzyme n=2 Tax=Natronobacterium gregoryi TaxID=44930 RepID=L0AF16_NATGS|nr:CCA tRNA nucleotidyltransferase [Natronobacterium gregoryi]AFZ72513.1 CCA-adding enzyme [Natronobacterium gregoryi SP2]ELY74386.1 tRNA CCA-pyrophosphorylase [Natronobacterium gregoryi SP2]PLK21483.1 CCA tRNA nucleotidyltransferase [Natronobacterium gregoryi SP2]SFI76703.1 tRNA adenylyltransferase [Natronobacterium gregoryi]